MFVDSTARRETRTVGADRRVVAGRRSRTEEECPAARRTVMQNTPASVHPSQGFEGPPPPPVTTAMAPNAVPIGPTYPPYGASAPGTEAPSPWPGAPYRISPGWTPPRPCVARAKPKLRPFAPKELGIAFGLAAVADVALVREGALSSGGFGLALVFGLVPVGLLLAARSWRTSARLGAISALLVLVAARCAYQPTATVVMSGFALVLAFTFALRARRVFVPDAFMSMVSAIGKLPSRLGAAAAGLQTLGARTRFGNVSVLPIVIPVGLVAVFLGVFALANPVVADGLGVVWGALARIVAFPSVERVLLWACALVAAASLLRPACRLAKGSEAAAAIGDASPIALLVARNALVGLNVLFAGYNALDARYLWTGSPPEGMHTQQYAHQGAFWLTVALLMLTAVTSVMFKGALAHDQRATSTRTLAYAWGAQGLVLGLGTYRRIAIHIAKSGLSDLRIVGILGTSLVVCGVVLAVWKLRNAKTFTWLLRRQLDAFALIAIVYAMTPTHLLSADVNVARVNRGEYRPVLHTFRQSHETESAAALLPLLDHRDARVRQGVAALLADERAQLRAVTDGRRSWREGDLASGHALAALDAAGPRIDAELGALDPAEAKRVLLEISRAANEDRSLEELLAIPAANSRSDSL